MILLCLLKDVYMLYREWTSKYGKRQFGATIAVKVAWTRMMAVKMERSDQCQDSIMT
jgi:hypothetical protein